MSDKKSGFRFMHISLFKGAWIYSIMGLNIILTLGTISNFYKVMNQKEKHETSKIFKIQDNELENILMKYILQSKHKGVIYV